MTLLPLTIFNEIDVGLSTTLTMIGVGTAFTVLVSLMAFISIVQKWLEPLMKRKVHSQEIREDKALAAAIGLSLVLNQGTTEHGND